jgi:prepilin-type N-terminal cleavage/methylation domain-containing protein
MPSSLQDRTGKGFTLIELLVVISIIAVLIGIILPSLSASRKQGRTVVCLSQSRQIATAVSVFASGNGSKLPENRTKTATDQHVTWRHQFVEKGFIPDAKSWRCPDHPGSPSSEEGMEDRGSKCVGDVASTYALNGHVLWREVTLEKEAHRADTAILRPSHTLLIAESRAPFPDIRVTNDLVAEEDDLGGYYGFWHQRKGVYSFIDGHASTVGLLETGSPDCRWHNGRDLSIDPAFGQSAEETGPHAHPDWIYLVSASYLPAGK